MRGAEAAGSSCVGSGGTNVGQPQLTLLFALVLSTGQARLQENSMKKHISASLLSYNIIISTAWG